MYGPFAAALSYIIHCGNINKSVFKSGLSVFRGLKLTQDEIEQRYQVGSSINLKGFTSTSINKKVALNFAFSEVTNEMDVVEKLPVLIEIQIKGSNQFFSVMGLSAYPQEDEFLLQDGI